MHKDMCKKCKTPRRRSRSRIGNISTAGVMGTLKNAALAGFGFVAGQALVSKVEFLKGNPGIAASVKLAGAVFLPVLVKGNAAVSNIAAGMAVGAMVDVVKMAAPDVAANQLGLGFPQTYYGSVLNPGVAGPGVTVTVD